jgi:hypothetical protein
MNATSLTNVINNETVLENDLFRDLADVEVVLVGGGEIAVVGS